MTLAKSHPQLGANSAVKALVLSGGMALGAYQLGALEGLAEGRFTPDWIAGTSIGALNGAIFAGNPPESRLPKLREFWEKAINVGAVPDSFPSWMIKAGGLLSALQTYLLGNTDFFRTRLRSLFAGGFPAHYDSGPLRSLLPDAVDFGYLNRGDIRFTLLTVDVATGNEVVFDTQLGHQIGPQHLLAAAGFLPDFAPIEIDGRVLGDGGFSRNAPAHLVLGDASTRCHNLVCYIVDLFANNGSLPETYTAGVLISTQK